MKALEKIARRYATANGFARIFSATQSEPVVTRHNAALSSENGSPEQTRCGRCGGCRTSR
jgi:hypothetical protein